jgi:hypothetical protein
MLQIYAAPATKHWRQVAYNALSQRALCVQSRAVHSGWRASLFFNIMVFLTTTSYIILCVYLIVLALMTTALMIEMTVHSRNRQHLITEKNNNMNDRGCLRFSPLLLKWTSVELTHM